jgi:hypothetical protein
MCPFVAPSAQCDQVLLHVATRLTAKSEVMHLQVVHATAPLASPAVPLQHLAVQVTVADRIQSESWAFAPDLLHDAFLATSDRKASCCGLGRNLAASTISWVKGAARSGAVACAAHSARWTGRRILLLALNSSACQVEMGESHSSLVRLLSSPHPARKVAKAQRRD